MASVRPSVVMLLVAVAVLAGCSGGPPLVRMKVNRVERDRACGSTYPDRLELEDECVRLPVEGIDSGVLHTGDCVIVQMMWNPNEEERKRGIGFVEKDGEITDCSVTKLGK